MDPRLPLAWDGHLSNAIGSNVMEEDSRQLLFPENISSCRVADTNCSSNPIVMYIHNLPEEDRDEEIVGAIVVEAKISGINDIVLKRVKSKSKVGWWGGLHYLPWKKVKQRPEILKVKMKITDGHPFTKNAIMQQMQSAAFCKAFNIQVTDHE